MYARSEPPSTATEMAALILGIGTLLITMVSMVVFISWMH